METGTVMADSARRNADYVFEKQCKGQYDQRILEVLFESETQEVERFDHDRKKHSYLCLDMLESLPCIPVVRRDTILFGAISTGSRIEVDSPISHFAGGMALFLCVAILWNIAGASAVPLIVGGKGYVLSGGTQPTEKQA